MIKAELLTKEYHLGKTSVLGLQDVSLSIERGSFISVVGPSGSGKSTLLNLIGCLDMPTAGQLFIEGQEITTLTKRNLAQIRAHKIGFIFQSFNLIPVLNVFENVELPLLFKGQKKSRKEIMSLIEAVGLENHVAHRPDELSGGQQQRVAIARALITDPMMVLADEPTANLDSQTAQLIIKLMLRLNQQSGTTFIFSTHDPDVVQYAHTIFRLKDGRLIDSEKKNHRA